MITAPKYFELSLQVQASDIDALGHVNNVVYLRWIQEISAAHWESLASALERNQWIWVVKRHEIDYHHAAREGDAVIAQTWVGETDGVKSVRHVRLFRKPDILLAEAKTTWVLVDPERLRPRRIGQEVKDILQRDQAKPDN
jgi:acyl-CoA thioester hydrolase